MKAIRFIVCLLLLPLTMWYGVGVAVRNLLFRWGIKKSVVPDVATIGIGNLRMGGTGKTPHTEYIIRLLSDQRVALLSRGYGRKTQGFVLADDGSDASQIGDEPYMIHRKFPEIAVAVCEDRVEGVEKLMQGARPPAVVVLDDVYQHRHIRPRLNILLTEYGDPFSRDFILPFGNLREFRCGRRRADIVVVTKCPENITDIQRREMRRQLKLNDSQQLFFSYITYDEPVALYEPAPMDGCEAVVLVTGIAHPEPLLRRLERQYSVVHLHFPDHHAFSADDCRRIAEAYKSLPSQRKAVLTTEKDAVRMLAGEAKEVLCSLPVCYIPIRVEFDDPSSFCAAVRGTIG